MIIILLILSISIHYKHRNLVTENLFLRTQLTSYKRKFKIFQPYPSDKIKLIALSFLLPSWKSSLILVQPGTLLLWRKQMFKLFWKLLSKRKKPGRPNTPWILIKLIRKIAKENKVWGATKLHGVLLKLGFVISERTVSKYIPKRPANPRDRINWKNFYLLHSDSMIVSDLFSIYSRNFSQIFRVVFFLDLKTRQVLHYEIQTRPITRWMRKVFKLAIRKKGKKNTSYLITDNDSLFGKRFSKYLERIGCASIVFT